jgi:hypothetical protein
MAETGVVVELLRDFLRSLALPAPRRANQTKQPKRFDRLCSLERRAKAGRMSDGFVAISHLRPPKAPEHRDAVPVTLYFVKQE